MVSIVTSVYDRHECLRRCLASVNSLEVRDYEHIIVADRPPDPLPETMGALVERAGWGVGRRLFAVLEARANNWGIAPAAAGLALARGKYVCFLSDDNGYTPGHFGPLLEPLERDPGLGFTFSSCRYGGRKVLNYPVPRFSWIDVGQPLIRRELFDLFLNGTLPFAEEVWDWRMIERLIRQGVRYRHVQNASFIFRLECYLHLMATIA
jgi:glycosyltransferase involved in cell wall biosynthesis